MTAPHHGETYDAYLQPAFPLRNRLRRAAWHFVYGLLFRFSPRSFHGWRTFLLRRFGARIGSTQSAESGRHGTLHVATSLLSLTEQ